MFTNLKESMQYIRGLNQLTQLVVALDGHVHNPADSTCLTVSLGDGSFCATAYYNTHLENVDYCLAWLKSLIKRRLS